MGADTTRCSPKGFERPPGTASGDPAGGRRWPRPAGRPGWCGSGPYRVRIGRCALGDPPHDLHEAIERLAGLGLGGLDHERLLDDEREVDGGRVDALVQDGLGDVQRRHAVLPLLAPRAEHDLVLADPVEGQVVGIGQEDAQVVRGEHRVVGDGPQPLVAVGPDVGVGPHVHPEVPAEGAHLADGRRSLPDRLEREPRFRGGPSGPGVGQHRGPIPRHQPRQGGRQERGHPLADPDRPRPRSAAAVRGAEGLVQVEVHDVEAGLARPEAAEDGVQVRPVHVGHRTGLVDGGQDVVDLVLEDAEGARVGEHQGRRVGAERGAQGVEVDAAMGVGGDGPGREADHAGGRRVRAVGAVRDDHHPALVTLRRESGGRRGP